jgi:hypothetical protein
MLYDIKVLIAPAMELSSIEIGAIYAHIGCLGSNLELNRISKVAQ